MMDPKMTELIAWVERCNAPYTEEELGSKDGVFKKRCAGCPRLGEYGCVKKLVLDLVILIKKER